MRAILHQLAVGSWFPALFRFVVVKRPHLFMGSLLLSHTLSNPLWFKLPLVWRCWPLGLTEVRENDLWGQPHRGAEH